MQRRTAAGTHATADVSGVRSARPRAALDHRCAQRGLRRRDACDRHAERRARHIVQSRAVEELHRRRIGAVYRFLVNARSGEVQGERPWSVVKIAFTVLTVLAILIAIIVMLR